MKLLGIIQQIPEALTVTVIALFYACISGFNNMAGDYQGFLCMLCLAFVLAFDGNCLCHRLRGRSWVILAFFSWVLLGAAFSMMVLLDISRSPIMASVVLMLIFSALTTRIAGTKSMLYLLPMMVACFILVPNFTSIMLYGSYPLRMMSTICSAGLLGLFDSRVVFDQTMIHIRGYKIAITDACSGIQQLEAMLLVAYLVISRDKCALAWKILHYLFIFPAVIIANAIRIIVTIFLFYAFGEAVFDDTPHVALGFFQVILVLALFIVSGWLLPERKVENEKTDDSGQSSEALPAEGPDTQVEVAQ